LITGPRPTSSTGLCSRCAIAETLAQDELGPALSAGEIVTTGTPTRAFPVAAGEEWTTQLTGIPLEGARIRFV
jgi:2-oxo-3-hexenedioate decarboxylase